jgi:hypothetical protein
MKLLVPTSLSDITLANYLRYLEELKLVESKNLPEYYLMTKMLEIFCNITEAEAKNVKLNNVIEITSNIKEILEQKPQRVEFFTVGSLKFGWVPKLDDLSWGEFLDLNSNISDWETIYISMAVLYRPVTRERKGKYLIEEYKGDTYHDAIKQMPMDAVLGAMVFFWNLGMELANSITKHLVAEAKNNPQMLNSLESTDGILLSMNYLEEILQSTKQ